MANDNADKGAQGNTDSADATAKAAADAAAATAAAAAAGKDGKTPEQKAADTGAEAGKASTDAAKAAADAAAAAAKGAPAEYKLKLPEKTTLEESDVKTIETIARENNWTNDEAQAALDRHHETLLAQSESFAAALKADKEYGGDNLAKTQERAKAILDRVRPMSHPRAKAFRSLLEKSGYGNHVEIVSFLADLGKLTEEDGAVGGDGAGGGDRDAASVLYGGEKK